jgi:hypothetical protein
MRMRWAGTTLRWTTAALAVILAACWITMLWVGVRWEGKAFKTYYSCDVARGALSIEYYDEDKSSVMSGSSWTLLKRVSPMKWGIIYSPHGGFMPTRLWIVIPLWLPFFLLCAVSAAPWGHLVHWLRRRANRCPCCGYDRTGLTRSTKCPECGAAPTDTEALARLRRGAKVLRHLALVHRMAQPRQVQGLGRARVEGDGGHLLGPVRPRLLLLGTSAGPLDGTRPFTAPPDEPVELEAALALRGLRMVRRRPDLVANRRVRGRAPLVVRDQSPRDTTAAPGTLPRVRLRPARPRRRRQVPRVRRDRRHVAPDSPRRTTLAPEIGPTRPRSGRRLAS